MRIRSLDPEQMTPGYGIGCQCVLPWQGEVQTSFSSTWCLVGPGQVARSHKHQEHEAFFIVRGRGRMRVDDETREVRQGDMILMHPWNVHELANLSDDEDLVFLDLCWEDMQQAIEANAEDLEHAEHPGKVLITSPSAAAPAAVAPALAAGTYARYLAMRGTDARLLVAPAGDATPARLAGELLAELARRGAAGEREGAGGRHLVLPLGELEERLGGLLSTTAMGAPLRARLERLLADGLPEQALTSEEGSLSLATLGGRCLDPKVETAVRCLATAASNGGWHTAFCDPERRPVLFFEAAEAYEHALLMPALLLAAGLEPTPPRALVATEALTLVGPSDAAGAEWARFALARELPEAAAVSIETGELEAIAQRELEGLWQPWLHRLGAKLSRDFAGKVPGTGGWTEDQQRFFQRLVDVQRTLAAAYEAESLSLQDAARQLSDLVRAADRFGRLEEHWREAPDRFEERRTGVALEVLAAKTLALVAAPLMPALAGRIWRSLGLEGTPLEAGWQPTPELVPGRDGQGAALEELQLTGAGAAVGA